LNDGRGDGITILKLISENYVRRYFIPPFFVTKYGKLSKSTYRILMKEHFLENVHWGANWEMGF
jgi:hypothetical protein